MDINAYISSGIIEQYALGATTQDEASILECVMKNNTEVEKAIFQAQEIMGDLAMAQSIIPALELKAKIANKLLFDVVDDTLTNQSSANELSNSKKVIQLERPNTSISDVKSKSPNFWMIAASILLLLSLGWNILNTNSKNTEIESLAKNNEALKIQIGAAEQQNNLLISADKIKLLGVEAHPELYATVLYSPNNQVHLQLENLPQAPEGKEYQLWAIVDGTPVDLGMYDQSNSEKLQAMKTVQNPQAFAITLENKGGSLTPTMEQMYVMGKVG